jgi:hypothetical protein
MKIILMTILSATLIGGLSFAETKESNGPSKEDRTKMAEAHEKMAACLKSDKPMKECREEMHEARGGMMGGGMMGMDECGPGMMGGKHKKR